MMEAAQKYNTRISVMRATTDLRMNMLAFHHPFAKNRNLHTTLKAMKCLQNDRGAKTVADLIRISSMAEPVACGGNRPGGHGCQEKAKELINRIRDAWNPNKESPQRRNLWHTP